MILVDTCFILEFMRRMYLAMFVTNGKEPASYVSLVGRHMTRTTVYAFQTDIMLLENQIPYKVLQKLFDLIPSSRRICNASGELSLQDLAFKFFYPLPILRANNLRLEAIQNATFSHLLDILHQLCSPTSQISTIKISNRFGVKSCAAELIKSGYKISLHSARMSIVDIKFIEGELLIPNFVMDEFTVTLLRNLIALEVTRDYRSVIASYCGLMHSLIRSREDVYLLERAGIIKNPLHWSNIQDFFPKLILEVNSSDFVFGDFCDEVNNYRIPVWRWRRVKGYITITWLRWGESIKDLKQDYFKNRWSIIASVAAIFVILLTLAQTIYTIRAYYPPYH